MATVSREKVLTFAGDVLMPTIAGASFLFAAVDIVMELTHHVVRASLNGESFKFWRAVLTPDSFVALLIAFVSGALTWLFMDPIKPTEAKGNERLFTRYLIGLGYFLLVLAIVSMVGLAGLAANGHLDAVLGIAGGEAAAPRTEAQKMILKGIALLAALTTTLLGALFYFANSLWKKYGAKDTIFDDNQFWGGLWFRLAEAIVLTIALFLLLNYLKKPELVAFLPMIGLFIGMTVKTSEVMVFGMIEKMLAAVGALVDAKPAGTLPAGAPAAGGAGTRQASSAKLEEFAALMKAHRQAAIARAKKYYQEEHPLGVEKARITAVAVEPKEPQAVAGAPGRYRTQGKATIDYSNGDNGAPQQTTRAFEILTEQKSGEPVVVVEITPQN